MSEKNHQEMNLFSQNWQNLHDQELTARLTGLAASALPSDPALWPDSFRAQLDAEKIRSICEFLLRQRALWQEDRGKENAPANLDALRQYMATQQIEWLWVPCRDRFLGEYIPEHDRILRWVSGFDGSAGMAVIGQENAFLWVDGRYVLQAEQQVDTTLWQVLCTDQIGFITQLGQKLPANSRLSFDPFLLSRQEYVGWKKKLAPHHIELQSLAEEPFSACWANRPPLPKGIMWPHDPQWSGVEASAHIAQICQEITKHRADALFVSEPENICWLLNVRGCDVPYTPLFHARLLLKSDGQGILFVDPAVIRTTAPDSLPAGMICADVSELAARCHRELAQKRVLVDDAQLPQALFAMFTAAGLDMVIQQDPITLAKSCKNAGEITNARQAHRRDAAALTGFFSKLARQLAQNPAKDWPDEVALSESLYDMRRQQPLFCGESFATIAAIAENGAVIHYRPQRPYCQKLRRDTLFLLDSGGQYHDGTTDITRTIAIGTAQDPHRHFYTLVLKGLIAISRSVFPEGTKGQQIDALARQFLWQEEYNYPHGTGHGVGSYLGVHEGPQRISSAGAVALQPGMIVSLEPGYYQPGAFGIRLENLACVQRHKPGWLSFETLTLYPFEKDLLAPELLTPVEKAWLVTYHQEIAAQILPLLASAERQWLDQKCQECIRLCER